MPRTLVCISASDGAGAEEVAPMVARRLGLPLVDEQIVARAAEEAGVTAEAVADVEQRRSLIVRMLDQLPATAVGASALTSYVPLAHAEPGPAGDDLRGLIRSSIEEVADRGSAVIVSHAASLALSGREDMLRVLITGSEETRRARLGEANGIGEREAGKLLARGDANRADYFKRFYGIRAELPTHYDLVLNTDRLDPEEAAEIVVHAAAGPAPSPAA